MRRMKANTLEESISDFFVVFYHVFPHNTHMVINNNKLYILTNNKPVKYGGRADQMTEYMDFKI